VQVAAFSIAIGYQTIMIPLSNKFMADNKNFELLA
jgi:hypothetical protein